MKLLRLSITINFTKMKDANISQLGDYDVPFCEQQYTHGSCYISLFKFNSFDQFITPQTASTFTHLLSWGTIVILNYFIYYCFAAHPSVNCKQYLSVFNVFFRIVTHCVYFISDYSFYPISTPGGGFHPPRGFPRLRPKCQPIKLKLSDF